MVVQSKFGSWVARCFINPSFSTLSVPFSASEMGSDIDTVDVVALCAVTGGCGVAGATSVIGAEGVPVRWDNQGAADGVLDACDAGLLYRDVDGVNEVCCCVFDDWSLLEMY